MTLQTNLSNLVTRMATENKALRNLINGNTPSLASLSTVDKTNLVNAINELKSAVDTLKSTPGGVQISDATTTTNATWSSNKINSAITAAIAALVNNAPAAQDTLKELADSIAAVAQADAGLVSAVSSQSFTTAQKLQACQNMGVGDPETNYVTLFESGLV